MSGRTGKAGTQTEGIYSYGWQVSSKGSSMSGGSHDLGDKCSNLKQSRRFDERPRIRFNSMTERLDST